MVAVKSRDEGSSKQPCCSTAHWLTGHYVLLAVTALCLAGSVAGFWWLSGIGGNRPCPFISHTDIVDYFTGTGGQSTCWADFIGATNADLLWTDTVMVLASATVILLAVLGCMISVANLRWSVIVVNVLLFALIGGQLAVTLLGRHYSQDKIDKVEDSMYSLRDSLRQAIDEDPLQAARWNIIQYESCCCGWFTYEEWYTHTGQHPPDSCKCLPVAHHQLDSSGARWRPHSWSDRTRNGFCKTTRNGTEPLPCTGRYDPTSGAYMNTKGCLYVFLDHVDKHITLVNSVHFWCTCALLAVQMLSVVICGISHCVGMACCRRKAKPQHVVGSINRHYVITATSDPEADDPLIDLIPHHSQQPITPQQNYVNDLINLLD